MDKYIMANCIKNIGFDFILNEITPLTKYGSILKENFKPFLPGQEYELLTELDKLQYFINLKEHKQLSDILKEIKYLGETFERAQNNVILDEVEFFEIKKFLKYSEKLTLFINSTNLSSFKDLKIEILPHLIELLDPENQQVMTFYIYDSYSPELASLRKERKVAELAHEKIKKSIIKKIELKYYIKQNIKNEFVIDKNNKNLIEDFNSNESVILSSETYSTASYKIRNTKELETLLKEINTIKLQEEDEELKIREILSHKIKLNYPKLINICKKIGEIDFLHSKAKYAKKNNTVKPEISFEPCIFIEKGRNIKLEHILKHSNKSVTPVSVNLSKNVTCITGANMGGKTVSMSMIGQIVVATAYGMFVPCDSAKISLFNHIHISVGDDQSIEKGLSTFGAEIMNLKYALEDSQDKSLILIDELAGGTNPKEGYAITKAVVEYLKNTNSMAIITTHYDNIASDKDIHNYQVKGLSLPDELKTYNTIEEISKFMDYTLINVENNYFIPKDAIHIANLVGIDKKIIDRAINIVKEGENAK